MQRSVQRSHRSSVWPPFLPWQSTHLRAHPAGHSWCLYFKRLYILYHEIMKYVIIKSVCLQRFLTSHFTSVWGDIPRQSTFCSASSSSLEMSWIFLFELQTQHFMFNTFEPPWLLTRSAFFRPVGPLHLEVLHASSFLSSPNHLGPLPWSSCLTFLCVISNNFWISFHIF